MPSWTCWPCSRGLPTSSPGRWSEAWGGSGPGPSPVSMRSRRSWWPPGSPSADPGQPGRRPRTVYSITPEGRHALTAWLAEPGTGPVLECEALVKIAYADQGSRDGLLANLAAPTDDTTAK